MFQGPLLCYLGKYDVILALGMEPGLSLSIKKSGFLHDIPPTFR